MMPFTGTLTNMLPARSNGNEKKGFLVALRLKMSIGFQ